MGRRLASVVGRINPARSFRSLDGHNRPLYVAADSSQPRSNMAYDFRPIILGRLGDPPPRSRAAREAMYERVRAEFDGILHGPDAAMERAAHALALEQAIDAIEAELSPGERWPSYTQTSPRPAQPQRNIDRATTSGRGKTL